MIRTLPGAVAAVGQWPARVVKRSDDVSTTTFCSIGPVDVFTATGPPVEVERRADTSRVPDKKPPDKKELPEPQRSLQSMAQQTKDKLKPPK